MPMFIPALSVGITRYNVENKKKLRLTVKSKLGEGFSVESSKATLYHMNLSSTKK